LGDEVSPGFACGVDDGVVIFEHGVREPVLAQILPDVLDRVQLGRTGRQENGRDVVRHVELARRMPSGAIEKQHGVNAFSDGERDFVEMKLHHVRVGIGKRQGRVDAARRAPRVTNMLVGSTT